MAYLDYHASPPIAAELRDLSARIKTRADVLVSDESLAITYRGVLQTFDLVIQRDDESADLLDQGAWGARSKEAIDGVLLSMVQNKLRSARAAV
ncbi:MAG: hypothetical protein ACOYLK_13755 [Sphingomonas sp.]|jgi:hypothetical protein